jgi:adenylate cyclase
MGQNQRRRAVDKVPFSIGAKLITIISLIVIISLGSNTALVSWLIKKDLYKTATVNNFEINQRSAEEAESTISNVRSNSLILMETVTAVGMDSAIGRKSREFFFSENPQVAAVFFVVAGKEDRLLVNYKFFAEREIDDTLAASYFRNQRGLMSRSVRGETVVANAAPHFSRAVLALFFPWQGMGIGAVLFSSEDMNRNFGSGANQSYMINTEGDLLSFADFSQVRSAVNISDEGFIRDILNSHDRIGKQELIESEFKFMQGQDAPAVQNIFMSTVESAKQNTLITANRASRAVSGAFYKLMKLININIKEPDPSVQRQDDSKQNDTAKKSGHVKSRQFVMYTKLDAAGAVVVTSIEYDTVFEGITATTRRNIFLTIAVLSISVIFIWFFSKTISVPLKTLASAARRIEGGHFEVELHPKGRDEIGILTTSFQRMSKALGIFGKFTNRDIAVKAMRGEIKPGGLPKHATVFFSDIREFTAKSEQFTKVFGNGASDRIVHWLNNYFSHMVECVEKTNGVVDKFIGDAVMAHWGTAYTAGSPRKDAFNCLKAALMMRKALYIMNQKCKVGDFSNPSIRIGCGINTGIVTAGQLGSDMRMEYTVIGDPVNLASRVEALTKPLGADILITEDTWKLIGDKFITEEMPSVTVKGKEKPVRVFAVVNFKGIDRGPRTLADVRRLLGIAAPDVSKVDVNADEKKYKIGEG